MEEEARAAEHGMSGQHRTSSSTSASEESTEGEEEETVVPTSPSPRDDEAPSPAEPSSAAYPKAGAAVEIGDSEASTSESENTILSSRGNGG